MPKQETSQIDKMSQLRDVIIDLRRKNDELEETVKEQRDDFARETLRLEASVAEYGDWATEYTKEYEASEKMFSEQIGKLVEQNRVAKAKIEHLYLLLTVTEKLNGSQVNQIFDHMEQLETKNDNYIN